MARKREKPKKTENEDESVADDYNAAADEARPGETLEDWNERMNAVEGRPHDANESRHPDPEDEFTDPNMGNM